MPSERNAWILCAVLLVCRSPDASTALTIDVRFPSGTLFSPSIDATAKTTINAAAQEISHAITTSLDAVSTDVFQSTNGEAIASFDFGAKYLNPVTKVEIMNPDGRNSTNAVTVFFHVEKLTGNALGQGGPTLSYELSGYHGENETHWQNAISSAAALAENAYTRGAGPILGTYTGEVDHSGHLASFSIDYGVNFGNVWFDIDTDNNNFTDSTTVLNDAWHFNHNQPVPNGKRDLYSVAMHEILHVLGVGNSATWESLRSGRSWSGSEAIALHGTGANLLASGGDHLAPGLLSTSIKDGSPQEVLMDPNFGNGIRKELTWLDLAFLRDIGFDTIEPSLPADYDLDGDVDGTDLAFLENWYGVNGSADADGDGDTDGSDFLLWQRNYTGPLPLGSTLSIPEPSSGSLLLLILPVVIGQRHRSL